jgi:hypothetical protein
MTGTTANFGTVTDRITGEAIRPATGAEWRRTADLVNGTDAGGETGAWADTDGRAVWVSGGPDPYVYDPDIRDLFDEAGRAGDTPMVALCREAVEDEAARAQCVKVILSNRMETSA